MTISMRETLRLAAFVSLFAGCASEKCGESDCADTGADDFRGDVSAELEEGNAAKSPWEGTPEGVGVLDFLNDEATTYYVLDREVPLDRRAAGNLIAHRDGGDRLWGSTDDDVYGSIDEVDSVRFVGQRSLDRLVGFASKTGWVPGAEDLLGIYDGVSFTVSEAEDTIAFVNRLDEETLDNELALDARAAHSIAIAQPIVTVDQLSRLYYVGHSALRILKNAGVDIKG